MGRRRRSLIALAVFLISAPALAQTLPVQPDNSLTPGAIASTDPAVVCGFVDGESYSRRHRVWHDKAGTLLKYGLPLSDMRVVEDDDRVPVCLGGDNADPRNHWPEPWAQAREKDRLEDRICEMVCRDHSMSLQDGQAIFLGNWIARYQRIFGQSPE